MNILDNLESVEEVAMRLGVSTRRVRVWCEEQRLVSRKIGREWVIVKGQSRPAEKKMAVPAIKLNGIKKAVGDFNKWQGVARIYFNRETLDVWTEVYTDGNSYDAYTNVNIVEVLAKTSLTARDNKTSMAHVQQLCESAM